MIQGNQFKAAEKWTNFMSRPVICLLVQKYLEMKMLKHAYDMVKRNNLMDKFPDVYHLYKESLLKKLGEKGLWDIAELKTNKDRHLLEYLVYLAMEAGHSEKVDELCERYSLEGFARASGPQNVPLRFVISHSYAAPYVNIWLLVPMFTYFLFGNKNYIK